MKEPSTLVKNIIFLFLLVAVSSCSRKTEKTVVLTHGIDESAGGGPAYIISTLAAV